MSDSSRREFLTLAGLLMLQSQAPGAESGEEVIHFEDWKAFNPEKPGMPWDELTSWITPNEQVFAVGHYGFPEVDAAAWKLEIEGLVNKPRSFSLDALKARPKQEYTATLECSGNPPSGGLVGNVRWTGTPLAPILKECGIKPEGVETVFFAADQGTEKIRGGEYPQHFARSLPVSDALMPHILLGYAMNAQPLNAKHGGPVRLIVPGFYGIAWVKWLNRIEIHDRKFLGRFMGRDYVTIRGEKRGGEVIWRETSVGRMNLKSVAARAVRHAGGDVLISGAAWSEGTPIRTVEVKIDAADWKPAQLTPHRDTPNAWTFWSYQWQNPAPGEHTIASRAADAHGRVQPGPDDSFITLKKTYWEANQYAVRKIRIGPA
jgi:DMSO/TMAO reductase YedYZ molybdopterin-dependent catalytic subunit